VTVLRYSLLRLLLLLGVLVGLWLVGGLWSPLRDPLWLVVATAVLSVVLSYFVLRGPREAMTQQLAQRIAARPGAHAVDVDADAEDVEVERASADGQPEAEQHAERELGASGVAQHRDEGEPASARPDDPERGPEQRR
jgi:hypothetical protein